MASTEVEFQPSKQKKGGFSAKWQETKRGIYNPDKKAFLGRDCKSWAFIGLFYLVFYACLAGFFAICLAVFFTTLDKNYPRHQNKGTPFKDNPGMGFRPMPDLETTLIRFEQGKASSYKVYTDHIQAFLNQYENEQQEGENFIDCTDLKEENRDKNKVCRFNVDDLGGECTWQKDFGYDEGQPCVLLKMNKVYGWEPNTYDNGTCPNDVTDRGGTCTDGYVSLTCEGQNPGDQENMGPVTFYPEEGGFSSQYFPYLNQEGYRQPIAFAKFTRPENGVVIQVWCKAWSHGLFHHKNDKAASIQFELMVD